MTFPLDLAELFGQSGQYIVYLLIGLGFGVTLEMAGFGISTRLAAQFYFRDQTVLKVMFTAIVVAMVLIFGATTLGLLDFNQIWVNPTYLVPGIIGGLVMGVGFIIGGFCPGTALVGAGTLKLDAIFFVLGTFFGVFLFGESVGLFEDFWNSTYMGRFTLPQLFGVDVGIVVVGVVIMALVMFFGAELLEQRFGNIQRKNAPKWRYGAGAILLTVAGAILVVGQPSTEAKWALMEAEKAPLLTDRTVMVMPIEILDNMHRDRLDLRLIDIRSESDYTAFHLANAEHVPVAELGRHLNDWQVITGNTVIILIGNDETASIEAWKFLTVENVPNVYILAGGVNQWIKQFGGSSGVDFTPIDGADDQLRYQFAEDVT
ncbi:MAG: YeeE/YedE family protein, partial [Anaerolineae bacterium]|nr:YeeE/YedE family protein [Anaerolineae bacterium]